MRNRKARLGHAVVFVLTAACAQEPAAPELGVWSLGAPGFATDGGSTPFHRVTGAAFLGDGSVAVADAGNARVAVFAPSGELLHSLGGEGDGPGEFRSPSHLFVFGDTITVYDQLALRFTVWNGPEFQPRSWGQLAYGAAAPNVEGAFGSSDFLLTSIERTPADARGLFVDDADLLRYVLTESEGTVLKRGPQRYLYFFGESTGNTTYRTPFFGSTSYAVVAGTIVTVPLHSTEMSFLDPSKGDVIASLLLSLEEREFDRREIDRYRDALLENAGDGASANRIRSAFDGIEPPETAPAVRRLVVVGDQVWAERHPRYGETSITWLIVDPHERQTEAAIELPATSRPMGGRGDLVILVERDDLGVETVVIRPVIQDAR